MLPDQLDVVLSVKMSVISISAKGDKTDYRVAERQYPEHTLYFHELNPPSVEFRGACWMSNCECRLFGMFKTEELGI